MFIASRLTVSYKYGAMRSTLLFLCGVLIKRADFVILRRVLFPAHRYDLRDAYSGFGGLVVSVLASGTQDREFKPGRSRRIFRAKKSSSRLPSEGT